MQCEGARAHTLKDTGGQMFAVAFHSQPCIKLPIATIKNGIHKLAMTRQGSKLRYIERREASTCKGTVDMLRFDLVCDRLGHTNNKKCFSTKKYMKGCLCGINAASCSRNALLQRRVQSAYIQASFLLRTTDKHRLRVAGFSVIYLVHDAVYRRYCKSFRPCR